MTLFFMAITVDGVELNVSWAADQSVSTKGGEPPVLAAMPDFNGMKRA